MAYKPEHVVDLDTGAIVAAPVHHADQGDTKTVQATLDAANKTLERIDKTLSSTNSVEVIADKGCFAKEIIKNLSKARWITRISEPERTLWYSWNGDLEARKAVYANRARLKSGLGKATMRKRGEHVERSFQHVLDRGGQRRTHVGGLPRCRKTTFWRWPASTLVFFCARCWATERQKAWQMASFCAFRAQRVV